MLRASMFALVACSSGPRVAAPTQPPAFAIEGAPELVASGVISSEYNEIRLAMSPDGNLCLWGSTDRPGGPGGWNIWMSRRGADHAWTAPTAVPFNSDANDFDPAFTSDGHFVYFFSNRAGGAGGDDIYRVPVAGESFGEVEHLGSEVNTAGDEWAPAPAPDGSGLLFASNLPGHKHDLYVAKAAGTGFARAVALPGTVNSPDTDELDATFVGDTGTIVFSRSTNVDNDPIALFVTHRGPSGYDAGTRLPDTVNVTDGYSLGPSIDLHEPGVLYFSSKRTDASAGKLDVYRIKFRPR